MMDSQGESRTAMLHTQNGSCDALEPSTGGEDPNEECGPESVAFDNVLQTIGDSIVRQVLTSLVLMSFMIPYGMAWINFVFVGYEPPHVCAPINETALLTQHSLVNDATIEVIYETCNIRVTSNKTGTPETVVVTGCTAGHNFVGGMGVSMKTEWGLVCENIGIAELFMTMMNVGMAFGSLVLFPMADKFGRKTIVIISSVFTFIFEFLVYFSPSISVAIVFKALSGIFVQNLSPLCNLYGQELIPTKRRQTYGVGLVVIWTIGMMFLGVVAYALQSYSWRCLQLFTALIGIPPLICLYFIHESVAWLLAEGKHEKALKIIEEKCTQNGTNFNVAREAYHKCVLRAKKSQMNKDETTVAKYGIRNIFVHRKLFVTTLVLILSYFTHNTIFTGIYLTGANFNLNRYFMFLILAATEFPTSFLCFFLIKCIGRIKIIMACLAITAICLLISTILIGVGSASSVHVDNASAAFFILGKFGINLSYTCLYAFTPEYYPTTLRSIGFGIGAFAARVGGMLSAYLFPLFQIANWAPGTVMIALCAFTIAVYPVLPETKGKELPTTIEAFEALFDKQEKKKRKMKHMTDLDTFVQRHDDNIKEEWNQTLENTLRL